MRFILTILASIFVIGLVGLPVDSYAKKPKVKKVSAAQPQANPKYAAFVVDADTGKILLQEDADKLRYPASLTKMMTLYLLFESLESGKIKLDTKLTVSAEAAGRPQTNLSMSEGDKISVRDAILALVIRSANDVAVVVAENLAGSEEKFAEIMTKRARQLGMKNTTFKNASGLPNPKQISTAKDLALLGIALKKHYPQYYAFFARTKFTFNDREYTSHNRVMMRYPGADGLKTGFINASGFNLVTSASRRGINLVGVVMGGQSGASRDNQMIKLLDQSFEKAAAMKGRNYVDEYPNSNRERARAYSNDNYQTATVDEEIESAVEAAAGEGDNSATAPAAPVVASTPAPTIAPKITAYEPSTVVSKLASPTPEKAEVNPQPFAKPAATTTAFIPTPKRKPKL